MIIKWPGIARSRGTAGFTRSGSPRKAVRYYFIKSYNTRREREPQLAVGRERRDIWNESTRLPRAGDADAAGRPAGRGRGTSHLSLPLSHSPFSVFVRASAASNSAQVCRSKNSNGWPRGDRKMADNRARKALY